jgi:hypothetical protein
MDCGGLVGNTEHRNVLLRVLIVSKRIQGTSNKGRIFRFECDRLVANDPLLGIGAFFFIVRRCKCTKYWNAQHSTLA